MSFNNEVHISSLVVHVLPEHLANTKAEIDKIKEAEIYGESEEGKLVVVLEAEQQGFITDVIERINHLPHVINTVLVYHQVENEQGNIDSDTETQHSQIEGEV